MPYERMWQGGSAALGGLTASFLAAVRPFSRELIEAAGAELRFLPPYSPDFNPIEMAFSKLKALLRKAAERTVENLWDAIGHLVDLITPAESANFFTAAGYEPE